MAVAKYGEWEIDVDKEKTTQLYRQMPVYQSQVYRNFVKYCETLSKEEHQFFEELCINPLVCNIDTPGTSKKRLPCGGYYFIYGKYVKAPKEETTAAEELMGNDFVDDRPDLSVYVGGFQFNFQNPENEFCDIPEDMPDGCICIRFWCEEMPWLLSEKCKYESIDPPRAWELHKIIKTFFAIKKADVDYLVELRQEVEKIFSDADVSFEEIEPKDVMAYKKQWLEKFLPENGNRREIEKVCLSHRKFCNFLWHLFSYEFLESLPPEQSRTAYDKKEKDNAVLIINTNDIGYRIYNYSKLKADILDELIDVTVTPDDFAWTYAKTHEEYCGPYFYAREK